MKEDYYRLPFSPKAAMMSNGTIETCGAAESIAQNLMLLIITKQGENRYDGSYGNDVWNVEFDNGVSSTKWEQIFITSLQRQIREYEPRLVNPHINAQIKYIEHSYETRNFSEVKKQVRVTVSAKLEATGENFNFSTELFLSPMSVD